MKYMGSKAGIAKYIAPILQEEIDRRHITTYVEPFCGGCNLLDKIKCEQRIASDINPYLIALLQYAQNVGRHISAGGDNTFPFEKALEYFPSNITRELYNRVRNEYNLQKNNNTYDNEQYEYPLYYIGLVGFLASYQGRFFDGGYAPNKSHRNYYCEARDNLIKQIPDLLNVDFSVRDYTSEFYDSLQNVLIYCDPPYINTKKYSCFPKMDYFQFWETVRKWSTKNVVYVSEQTAPDDFEVVWSKEVVNSTGAGLNRNTYTKSEKLFRLKEGL